MPKVLVNSTKGLFQETGSGVSIANGISLTPVSLVAPAAAAATASSTIGIDQTVVIVTNATNADDRIYLPAPASVPAGKIYYLVASEGFELSSKGDGTNVTTINGISVTNGAGAYAAELAITVETVVMCIRDSATSWRVVVMADGGTPDA